MGCIRRLQEQHSKDLIIFRSRHSEIRNRALHWILIPVEVFSFFLFLAALIAFVSSTGKVNVSEALLLQSVGWTIGIISILVSENNFFAATASLTYHVLVARTCGALVRKRGVAKTFQLSAITWSLAWLIQVGIGHWILEGNQPNVATMEQVSFLAMTQSVLIAWSC